MNSGELEDILDDARKVGEQAANRAFLRAFADHLIQEHARHEVQQEDDEWEPTIAARRTPEIGDRVLIVEKPFYTSLFGGRKVLLPEICAGVGETGVVTYGVDSDGDTIVRLDSGEGLCSIAASCLEVIR